MLPILWQVTMEASVCRSWGVRAGPKGGQLPHLAPRALIGRRVWLGFSDPYTHQGRYSVFSDSGLWVMADDSRGAQSLQDGGARGLSPRSLCGV